MPNCVVLNCKNSTSKGFRLFKLPSIQRNFERRQIWCNLIARPTLHKDARVCQCHFSDKQFENARMDGKKKLKPNAIPDLLKLSTTNDSIDNKSKQITETIVCECSHLTNIEIKVEEDSINNISHEEDDSMMNDTNYKDSFNNNSNELVENEPFENTNYMVENLKKRLKYASRKCRYYEKKLQQKNHTNLEKIFNEDQLKFLETHKRMGTMWSEDTITKALTLYMTCGTEGYNEIRRQKLPYPSIRTLQHRLKKLKSKQGILGDVFEVLNNKMQDCKHDEKRATLTFDEVTIKPGLQLVISRPTMTTIDDQDSSNQLATNP